MKRGSTLRRAGRTFCDRRHNGSPRLGDAAHIRSRFHLRNVVATQREAPMTRLVTSLGTLIALLAIAPAAEAGSYAFSIAGHRFQVEAPRNCRSASCVSVSSHRSFRPDVDTTPAPAPVLPPPQPLYPVAPVRPAQAIAVAPATAQTAPVLASTTSQPIVLPQAPSSNPPRVELPQTDPPKTVALDPPAHGGTRRRAKAAARAGRDEP